MKKLPKAQLGAIIKGAVKYGMKGAKTGAKIGARAAQKSKALTMRAKKLNNLDLRVPGTRYRLAMNPKNYNNTLIDKAYKLAIKDDEKTFFKTVLGSGILAAAVSVPVNKKKTIKKKKIIKKKP